MAERPIDINLTAGSSAATKITAETKEKTESVTIEAIAADDIPEGIPESRADKRARLIQIYERGVVGDRLHVPLPDNKVGQWVHSDPMAVHRMEGLGYTVDKEYAPKRRLHDKGDGASYVGDVVFMIADKETREIIDEIKAERYERLNNPKNQKEDSDFATQNRALSSAGIGTINESKAHSVKKAEIEQALKTT